MNKNSLPISISLVQKLTKVLSQEEILVYLSIKLLIYKNQKMPSVPAVQDVCGTKAHTIITKMKRRGLLPSGKLNLTHLNTMVLKASKSNLNLRLVEQTKNIRIKDQAKILTLQLMDNMKANGVTRFTRQWFGKQLRVAIEMLLDGKISFDEWGNCIAWIFTSSFLKDHCNSMYKVSEYYTKYELRKKVHRVGSAPRMRVSSEDDPLWAAK